MDITRTWALDCLQQQKAELRAQRLASHWQSLWEELEEHERLLRQQPCEDLTLAQRQAGRARLRADAAHLGLLCVAGACGLTAYALATPPPLALLAVMALFPCGVASVWWGHRSEQQQRLSREAAFWLKSGQDPQTKTVSVGLRADEGLGGAPLDSKDWALQILVTAGAEIATLGCSPGRYESLERLECDRRMLQCVPGQSLPEMRAQLDSQETQIRQRLSRCGEAGKWVGAGWGGSVAAWALASGGFLPAAPVWMGLASVCAVGWLGIMVQEGRTSGHWKEILANREALTCCEPLFEAVRTEARSRDELLAMATVRPVWGGIRVEGGKVQIGSMALPVH